MGQPANPKSAAKWLLNGVLVFFARLCRFVVAFLFTIHFFYFSCQKLTDFIFDRVDVMFLLLKDAGAFDTKLNFCTQITDYTIVLEQSQIADLCIIVLPDLQLV